jgi:hypothetical protein
VTDGNGVETAPAGQVLSIISDRTLDGVYVPTVALDDRHLLTLDRERALPYVAAWADAIARAEFDAAVYAQLTGIGIDVQTAVAVVVNDLRPDRPPLDDAATAPLRLEPILSGRTKRGQVAGYLGDEHVVQLDAPAVYNHIGKVLPVVMTCDLDGAYRRYAIGQLGQPAWRAEAMVDDLGVRWRLPEMQGADGDRWVREQFAGIVAGSESGGTRQREPWRANRRQGSKKKKR